MDALPANRELEGFASGLDLPLSSRENFSEKLNVLVDGSASRIDHSMLAIPWMIFAGDDLLPS